jgi:hypothetical protein
MKRLLIPALLALAFQSTSVFAANKSSAEASIDWNAMTFTLIDLNPADGQLPSVVWSGQYGDTSANAYGNDGIHSSSISESYHASSATSVVGSNAVTAYSTGTSTYNNQSVAIAANADASTIPVGSSSVSGSAGASGSLHSAFSLSGAGVMVISVPYTIKVTGDLYDYYSDRSFASMSINGYYSASDGSYSGSGNANKNFDSYWSGNQSYSGVFTLAVANSDSLLTTSGYLDSSLSANASANSYVPGVPEPETYAMMLAGLGLVGTMARRRTSKSA